MASILFRLSDAPRMQDEILTQVLILNPFSEQIQQHLLKLRSGSIDKANYVTNCIATVQDTLQLPEYDFSEVGIKNVSPLFELFKEITEGAAFMAQDEVESIRSHFTASFCETLGEKWSNDAAKSFYPIPALFVNETKITAAQLWTHHFFCALNQLNQWQGPQPLPGEYVAKFSQKTLHHFRKHSHSVNEQKFKVMIDRMEKDPVSFEKNMAKAIEKAEKDPSSLSFLEKEYTDFLKMQINYTMRCFSDIDKEADLLNKCVWNGYTLIKMKKSITEFKSLFAETFKE